MKISFEISDDKFDMLRAIVNQECDDVIADTDIFRTLFLIENLGREEIDLRDDISNITITDK